MVRRADVRSYLYTSTLLERVDEAKKNSLVTIVARYFGGFNAQDWAIMSLNFGVLETIVWSLQNPIPQRRKPRVQDLLETIYK